MNAKNSDTRNKKQFSPQEIAERCSAYLQENDICAETLTISIDSVGPGKAQVSMKISDQFLNGHGFCQGGIITLLADTAFAHASNSYNRVTVAQGLSVDFLLPVKAGEILTAIAVEKARSRLTGVYEIQVLDSMLKLVAIVSGKSFQKKSQLLDLQ